MPPLSHPPHLLASAGLGIWLCSRLLRRFVFKGNSQATQSNDTRSSRLSHEGGGRRSLSSVSSERELDSSSVDVQAANGQFSEGQETALMQLHESYLRLEEEAEVKLRLDAELLRVKEELEVEREAVEQLMQEEDELRQELDEGKQQHQEIMAERRAEIQQLLQLLSSPMEESGSATNMFCKLSSVSPTSSPCCSPRLVSPSREAFTSHFSDMRTSNSSVERAPEVILEADEEVEEEVVADEDECGRYEGCSEGEEAVGEEVGGDEEEYERYEFDGEDEDGYAPYRVVRRAESAMESIAEMDEEEDVQEHDEEYVYAELLEEEEDKDTCAGKQSDESEIDTNLQATDHSREAKSEESDMMGEVQARCLSQQANRDYVCSSTMMITNTGLDGERGNSLGGDLSHGLDEDLSNGLDEDLSNGLAAPLGNSGVDGDLRNGLDGELSNGLDGELRNGLDGNLGTGMNAPLRISLDGDNSDGPVICFTKVPDKLEAVSLPLLCAMGEDAHQCSTPTSVCNAAPKDESPVSFKPPTPDQVPNPRPGLESWDSSSSILDCVSDATSHHMVTGHGSNDMMQVQEHSSHDMMQVQEHSSHDMMQVQEHSSHDMMQVQEHSSHHMMQVQEHSSHHMMQVQEHSSHHMTQVQEHSSHHMTQVQEHSSHHMTQVQEHSSHHMIQEHDSPDIGQCQNRHDTMQCQNRHDTVQERSSHCVEQGHHSHQFELIHGTGSDMSLCTQHLHSSCGCCSHAQQVMCLSSSDAGEMPHPVQHPFTNMPITVQLPPVQSLNTTSSPTPPLQPETPPLGCEQRMPQLPHSSTSFPEASPPTLQDHSMLKLLIGQRGFHICLEKGTISFLNPDSVVFRVCGIDRPDEIGPATPVDEIHAMLDTVKRHLHMMEWRNKRQCRELALVQEREIELRSEREQVEAEVEALLQELADEQALHQKIEDSAAAEVARLSVSVEKAFESSRRGSNSDLLADLDSTYQAM